MSEEERVFEYLRAYVKRGGTTPTIRKLCREFDTTPPTLYKKYGPLEDLCRKANVEIDDQTRVRLRMSMKATRKHVHRAEKKRTGNNAHALKQPQSPRFRIGPRVPSRPVPSLDNQRPSKSSCK